MTWIQWAAIHILIAFANTVCLIALLAWLASRFDKRTEKTKKTTKLLDELEIDPEQFWEYKLHDEVDRVVDTWIKIEMHKLTVLVGDKPSYDPTALRRDRMMILANYDRAKATLAEHSRTHGMLCMHLALQRWELDHVAPESRPGYECLRALADIGQCIAYDLILEGAIEHANQSKGGGDGDQRNGEDAESGL